MFKVGDKVRLKKLPNRIATVEWVDDDGPQLIVRWNTVSAWAHVTDVEKSEPAVAGPIAIDSATN
jgi:hypothetical protein